MRTRVATDLARLAAPALVGASAFAGMGVLSTGAAAPASAAGACAGTSGVTVVVQFPSGSATGCAPGRPGTALNALRSAGFSTTGVVGYGDAFICSINGYPVKTMCPRTPPTSAYWAVFSAKRGGSWTYANLGAASLPAPAGSVVGFRFGSGAAPSVRVPAAVSTPKPSTSTQKTTAKSTPHKPATQNPSASQPSSSPTRTSATSSTAKSTAAPGSPQAKPSSDPTRSPKGATSPSSSSMPTSPSASGRTPGQGAIANPKVKATAIVEKDGKKQKVITFDDDSSITLDPNSTAGKKYEVGVAKEGGKDAVPAPTSTSVPAPKNSAHPSISTSGSVPGVPAPQSQKSGNGSLPGILAGVGVLGVATVGAGYAMSRRGG